jgi:dethiobiotin synthase
MRYVVVTGTSTGVGKTIATAALAATTPGRVLVVKPVQTGAADGDSDAGEITRLSGVACEEWVTLPEPLAPDVAARRAGVTIPTVAEHADRLIALADGSEVDTLIIEGAGGLLVRLDSEGGTLLDLIGLLGRGGTRVEVILVASAGLGTLNHTELTLAALRQHGEDAHGLIIGSWPDAPGLAELCNREDLPRVTSVPLLGVIPAGAGLLDRESFAAAAGRWFV